MKYVVYIDLHVTVFKHPKFQKLDIIFTFFQFIFSRRRLGLGACTDVFIPTSIQAFSGKKVGAIACGDTHTLVALEGSGDLYTFGRNQVRKKERKIIFADHRHFLICSLQASL